MRTYVQLNFGIALIYGLLPARRSKLFHERSMSEYFGCAQVRFVLRRGTPHEEAAHTFADLIRKRNQLQRATGVK